jgi:hypothetical protein
MACRISRLPRRESAVAFSRLAKLRGAGDRSETPATPSARYLSSGSARLAAFHRAALATRALSHRRAQAVLSRRRRQCCCSSEAIILLRLSMAAALPRRSRISGPASKACSQTCGYGAQSPEANTLGSRSQRSQLWPRQDVGPRRGIEPGPTITRASAITAPRTHTRARRTDPRESARRARTARRRPTTTPHVARFGDPMRAVAIGRHHR